MEKNSMVWTEYYEATNNKKPMIPESFIARVFLSQTPVKLLKNYDFNNKKVLDIGCGDGRHSSFLSELGFDVLGCEIDNKKVKKLEKHFPDSYFFTAISSKIDLESDSLDYVVAANSIYYLENSSATIYDNLDESYRILKSGGCFVVSFVGEEHFILDNCTILDDKSIIIKSDPLNFRNETRIRPIWSRTDLLSLFDHYPELEVHKVCEILDKCDDVCRHLYYCTIYKR